MGGRGAKGLPVEHPSPGGGGGNGDNGWSMAPAFKSTELKSGNRHKKQSYGD